MHAYKKKVEGVEAFPTQLNISERRESVDVILLVGRSRNCGRCNAHKKDGQQYGSWCNTRASEARDLAFASCNEPWRVEERACQHQLQCGKDGSVLKSLTPRTKQWGFVPNGSSNGGGATPPDHGPFLTIFIEEENKNGRNEKADKEGLGRGAEEQGNEENRCGAGSGEEEGEGRGGKQGMKGSS
ncbi:hypothetical protein JOM56_007660 [Amanita muscaria]